MADDEFGTMILSSDNLNSNLVMPEIPIRPNVMIPKTIGILLLLGGLIFSLIGLTVVGGQYIDTDYGEQTKLYQLMGIDITAEELELLDSDYKEKNYYLITGLLQIFPGLILIVGGIQLILCKKIGVYTSVFGGVMLFVLNLVSNYWGSIIDSNLGISLETQWDTVETVMCSVCNLFCVSLPLIPMLVPTGKAALTQNEMENRGIYSEE